MPEDTTPSPEEEIEDTDDGDAHEVPKDLLDLHVALEAQDAGLI